ncbi:MarR family winged helix-turn-helix transcriptional regulator [Kribbella yunnanensis]|uniref:MarR family winged helix-turn-helix transcriptional regulator n=1 Tax=Kribbella yunnanensis TaxID=190194 RepID=UPI0031D821AF
MSLWKGDMAKSQRLAAGPALIRVSSAVAEHYERISSDLGMTTQQARMLFVLHRRPTNMLGLGSVLGVGKSTMTGVVARMERAGLVVRSADPADRRNFVVVPTDRGAEVAEEFERRLRDEVTRMLHILKSSERETFAALLTKVIMAEESSS